MNERFRSKYREFKSGYYLFKCSGNEVVWQSDDFDEAKSLLENTSSGLTSSSLLVFRLWVGYPFGEQILPQFQGRNDAEIVCSSLIE